MNLIFKLFICLFLASSVVLINQSVVFAQNQTIRVMIQDDVESFSFVVRKNYKLYDVRNNRLIKESKSYFKDEVSVVNENTIKMGKSIFKLSQIKVDCSAEGQFFLNKRRYKGDLNIILKENAKFALVNVVDLEDYLKSVVPSEIPWYWPYEVLKAQAVIARTFAVYKIGQNAKNIFDVTADTYSQVYGGDTSRRFRASIAVEKTDGLVLKCNGKIFPAFFHATCGGYTENPENLWGPSVDCIKSVKCGYCKTSPHYKWLKSLTADEITGLLQKKGINVKGIKNIKIIKLNSSNRVEKLLFDCSDGQKSINGKDFRNALGANIIKSLNFTITKDASGFNFDGLGWGHGVGFCQWGGYFMARSGKDFKEILTYYYPSSLIEYLK